MYLNVLVQRGITSERIWLEEKSTSTRENLMFSLDLVENKTGSRPEKIGMVSSEFHLYRASLFAKECGAVSYDIPAKTSNPIYFMNYYLREIVGVWYFILFDN